MFGIRATYVLLRACGLDLTPAAFGAQSNDITRQVRDWALFGKDAGSVGRRTSHVEVANLMAAASQVPQGDELGCSWCCHHDEGDKDMNGVK